MSRLSVAIVVYACLAAEFFFRYFTDRPFRRAGSRNGSTDTIAAEFKMPITQRMKLMILAMTLMATFLLIRYVQLLHADVPPCVSNLRHRVLLVLFTVPSSWLTDGTAPSSRRKSTSVRLLLTLTSPSCSNLALFRSDS